VGSGEFISHGSLEVAGQGVYRVLFVCPGGNVGSIYYHQSESEPNIRRGNLEFGILFRVAECSSGLSLEGKLQQTGEGIIASLQVP
jgi:hypothetical protein